MYWLRSIYMFIQVLLYPGYPWRTQSWLIVFSRFSNNSQLQQQLATASPGSKQSVALPNGGISPLSLVATFFPILWQIPGNQNHIKQRHNLHWSRFIPAVCLLQERKYLTSEQGIKWTQSYRKHYGYGSKQQCMKTGRYQSIDFASHFHLEPTLCCKMNQGNPGVFMNRWLFSKAIRLLLILWFETLRYNLWHRLLIDQQLFYSLNIESGTYG